VKRKGNVMKNSRVLKRALEWKRGMESGHGTVVSKKTRSRQWQGFYTTMIR
jgi:hypothetical protein